VMATGAPAAVVSGVGAANMVLRDLRQSEYEPRKFARSYIRFVDLPYRRPAYHGEPLTLENAHLAAAQCQWCEDRPCRTACPARVDIPGFLRRMEVQNWAGAARRIRERNPLGEVCGYTCGPDAPCQRQCYRTEFAGTPVRIPELQRLACEAAGEAGWPALDTAQVDRWMATYGKVRQDIKCAMVGAGAAAWSCAYYLALAGRSVEVYDLAPEPDQRPPAGWPQPRLQGVPPQAGLQAAIRRDLAGILRAGVKYRSVAEDELRELLRVYARTWDSPYWALAFEPSAAAYIAEALKVKWPPEVEPSKGGTPGRFGGYALGPLEPPDPSSAQAPRSVVQAAADGRRVAIRILVNVPR